MDVEKLLGWLGDHRGEIRVQDHIGDGTRTIRLVIENRPGHRLGTSRLMPKREVEEASFPLLTNTIEQMMEELVDDS